jgi:uncharacterized protein (TIGR02145 family)
MKTLCQLILATMFTINIATAQDTLYIYKSGSLIRKYAISNIDSIIFYKASDKPLGEIILDKDGNIYHSVTIGTQVWMTENLKTTKFNDDTNITLVTNNSEWGWKTSPAYCSYNNTTNADTINTFGRLYNRYAIKTGKLCPTGWHVPNDSDWTTLIDYLGGANVAGGKLKETGTAHWMSPNTGADNSSGFKAIPSGYRTSDGGYFYHIGRCGYWWNASDNGASKYLFFDKNDVVNFWGDGGQDGYSVRCVMD